MQVIIQQQECEIGAVSLLDCKLLGSRISLHSSYDVKHQLYNNFQQETTKWFRGNKTVRSVVLLFLVYLNYINIMNYGSLLDLTFTFQ